MTFYEKTMPPPPSYLSTLGPHGAVHPAPPPPPPPAREDMLEGRVLALTKENEKLRAEITSLAPAPVIRGHHSRTSSTHSNTGWSQPSYQVPQSPVGPPSVEGTPRRSLSQPRASEDDMFSLGVSQYHDAGDARYAQLLAEYRKVCLQNDQLQQQQQQQQQRAQSGPRDFAPAPSQWHGGGHGYSQAPVMAPPPPPPPGYHHAAEPYSPSPHTPTALFPQHQPQPQQPPSGPASPKQAAKSQMSAAASKLAAPPQSSQMVKKISKKQQEAQDEVVSKEAYIAHLERLIQQKDEQLAKLEGRGPEMLDTAVQATVWTSVARTQTADEDDDPEVPRSSSTKDSPVDRLAGSCSTADGKSLLLDAQNLLVQCAFTTLRPLTLQFFHEPLGSSSTSAPPIPANSGCASIAGGAQLSNATSPQPRWAHRPYALSKKRSSGQLSADSTAGPDLADVLAPMPSSMRWADEPCEFDLQQTPNEPSPQRRMNSSTTSAGGFRDDKEKSFTRGSSTTQAWRGGSRTSGKLSAASTI